MFLRRLTGAAWALEPSVGQLVALVLIVMSTYGSSASDCLLLGLLLGQTLFVPSANCPVHHSASSEPTVSLSLQ